MNEWISAESQMPKEGELVVILRTSYPMFYWVGEFKNYSPADKTDRFDYWMPLPSLSDE